MKHSLEITGKNGLRQAIKKNFSSEHAKGSTGNEVIVRISDEKSVDNSSSDRTWFLKVVCLNS